MLVLLCSVAGCTAVANRCALVDHAARFNPKTSILVQKRHPYTGNVNSETPGDS